VYYDGSSGHDFWGVISPVSGASYRWYGLNYATTNPDIYSGDLTGTGTLQASVPTNTLKYQNTADTLLAGSALLTSPGAGKLSGAMSVISTPSIPTVSFAATTPAGFTYSQAAQLSTLAGGWTGHLSFGSGESGVFTVNIAAGSGAISQGGSFASCQWNASSSVATPVAGVNLFALTLQMDHSTLCDTHLDGKTLTGIAFIAPGAGNSQRLVWVATTPDGHAISFKAER
jgi:hypothetical protein